MPADSVEPSKPFAQFRSSGAATFGSAAIDAGRNGACAAAPSAVRPISAIGDDATAAAAR